MTTSFRIITSMLYIAFLTTIDILLGNVLSTTKLECQIENISRSKECKNCYESVIIIYTYPIFNCSNTMKTAYLSSYESEKLYKKLKSKNTISCYNTKQTDVCNLELAGEFHIDVTRKVKFNFVGRGNNNPSNVLMYYLTYIVFIIFVCFSTLAICIFICVIYYSCKKKYIVDDFAEVKYDL